MCLFAKPSSRSSAVENSNKRQTVKESNTTRTEQHQQQQTNLNPKTRHVHLYSIQRKTWVPHMNNKQTKSTCTKDSQTKSAQQGYYHNHTYSEAVK